MAVLAADGQYTADALTGPLNGIYSAVSLEWDAMADSAEGGLFRRARLTDLLAAYGVDACQDLVLIPFKTNLEDSDLTTEEYNLTGLLDYPILANAGCFALQDTGDAAALKSAESAVLWLYSSGDGEKALTNTLGVITPWNTASDTTTLGASRSTPPSCRASTCPRRQRPRPLRPTRKPCRAAHAARPSALPLPRPLWQPWVQNKEYIKNTSEREEG